MKTTQNRVRLLPHYFKKVGVITVLFSFFVLIPAVYLFKDTSLLANNQTLVKLVTLDFIIAGVFVFCLAEEKVEDELILILRLKSIAFAFIFGVVYTVVQPLINFIFQNEMLAITDQQIVLCMLAVYVAVFAFKRRMS